MGTATIEVGVVTVDLSVLTHVAGNQEFDVRMKEIVEEALV